MRPSHFCPALVALSLLVLSSCGPSEAPTSPATGTRSRTPVSTEPSATASTSSSASPDPGNDGDLNFVVETFDGGEFSLAQHRGMPVVLNFWESW